jgi:uncharacterized membrane protein YeiH
MRVVGLPVDIDAITVALDLVGTFVFALSGAVLGVRHRLDVFGVLALSFAAGNTGGIVRDVLIGTVPPAALRGWWYVAASGAAGLVTLRWNALVYRLRNSVQLLDAAGLALFAISGAKKALAFDVAPLPAALLGMLTGIGGGVMRDVLVSEVPTVLRKEIYAVAGLAGAAVVVIGDYLELPSLPVALAGAGLCFAIRFASLHRGWHLPVAGARELTPRDP